MDHWWKRRRAPDEDIVDLRRIDAVIDVRPRADEPAADAAQPEPPDRAHDEWERSAGLVQYPSDVQR